MKDAWVLKLREESKIDGMIGDYYFEADDNNPDFLTQELNEALIIYNKEAHIKNLKMHEELMYEQFGKDAICNFGYTNITNNFEFVAVEVENI